LEERSHAFNGFTPDAVQFLKDIRDNNNKTWFEANKQRYQDGLVKPFQYLVSDLSGFMLTIDPNFVTTPAVNKTISRIYRDTRFSKDKSLFRGNMWLTFKRRISDWEEAPAFYFEITPEHYGFGMGFYNASKVVMDQFRDTITAKPEHFLEIIAFYRETDIFTLEGDRYKKQLRPDLPQSIREWLQFKSFYLSCQREIDGILFSMELTKHLIYGFGLLAPLYGYLWEIKTAADRKADFLSV
jgi:uncharacterized protein (TIGR02453 family)